MINQEEFTAVLAGLQEVLPMSKTLSEAGLRMAWALFPKAAKERLEVEQLLYAVQQRVLDPEPPKAMAITQQLLRYLYPVVDGTPSLEQGLRPDLGERMQKPEVFHPLRVAAEHRAVEEVLDRRLLEPAQGGALDQVNQVVRPLLLAAKAAREEGPAEPLGVFEQQQLAAGALLAAGSLVGRWTLESLGPQSLAQTWIRARPAGWAAMQAAAQERYGS